MLIAALELGGTKTIGAVMRSDRLSVAQIRVETRRADETLDRVKAFFAQAIVEHGPIAAIGIASFGPADVDRKSQGWGRIHATVKPGWSGADVAGPLGRTLNCPVAFDTDVNAAALAEARLGAGVGCDPLVYLTVGTGIGGGLIVAERPVHGLMHPEMGHLLIRRHPDDAFAGGCSFHGDCAEGLAAGPSILARFGANLDTLALDHPFRDTLSDYLGQLCAAIVLISSPQRIVIGGGVMTGSGLHDRVAAQMRRRLCGYVASPALVSGGFIAPPRIEDAGLAGGFLLARDMLEKGEQGLGVPR